MLKIGDIVKIIRILGPNSVEESKHSPKRGDIGRIMKVLELPSHEIRYSVTSFKNDEALFWIREFEPNEIKIAPEYQASEQCLTYMRVRWFHEDTLDPIFFYYEIQEDDWAKRGIEEFADGSLENVGHGLYEGTIPRLEEFAEMKDFEATEIEKREFETKWEKLMEDRH